MKAIQGAISGVLRGSGQSLDMLGRCLELNPCVEKLMPSLRGVAIKGAKPSAMNSVFVAPNAVVAGNVSLGQNSAVWYGAIIRGGEKQTVIGNSASIGDLSVVSSTAKATQIGHNVSVGSGVTLSDSVVESNAMIGSGAKVFGAHIESNAVIASGSIVPAGSRIASGQLWAGAPAAFVRQLTATELSTMQAELQATLELAAEHAVETSLSWEAIQDASFEHRQIEERHPESTKRLQKEELSQLAGEVEGHDVPGRIFDHPVSATYGKVDLKEDK